MRDSYSERLNILFHCVEETVGSNETKEQKKTAFEDVLKDAFELESDAIEVVVVHRLPNTRSKNKVNLLLDQLLQKY